MHYGISGALTRAISGGITESARHNWKYTSDKWRDNSECGWKKEERGREMALLSHSKFLLCRCRLSRQQKCCGQRKRRFAQTNSPTVENGLN